MSIETAKLCTTMKDNRISAGKFTYISDETKVNDFS